IEGRILVVGPVKLTVAPDQPSRLSAGHVSGLVEKQGVYGRKRMACSIGLYVGQQATRDGPAIQIGPNEEPRPRCRGERYRYGELGIVAAAEPGVSLGPGEVEHELAIGVSLTERGHCRGQSLAVLQGEIAGIPARAEADTTGVLESCEELVTQKRVFVAVQRIPLTR